MTAYALLAITHAGCGTLALVTFWIAGMARKGSPLHVRAGKVYLLSMVALLTLALPMSLMIIARGGPGIAIGCFLLYLLVITTTSVWLSWRAIRDKRDWARFTGPVHRGLMWLNLASGVGVAMVGLFLADRMQLIIVSFSLIGILTFVRMRRFAAQPPTETRWWMRQHLSAMLGNGVATHIAFLSIGLPKLLPWLAGPLFQNIAWIGPLGVSALAGAYLTRKYLRAPVSAAPLSGSSYPASTP